MAKLSDIVDLRNTIKTGDTLLFSGNTTTAFLIKFFTASDYNHIGIAVRLDENKRVCKRSGKLYVLEVNAISRYDIMSEKYVKGIALTDYDDLVGNYNIISLRKLDEKYKKKGFCRRIETFIDKYKGINYNSTLGPIIGVWIGCPIAGIQKENEMFCTEMVVYFYRDVCDSFPTVEKPGRLYTINDLLITDSHNIYTGSSTDVYTDYSDCRVSLVLPIITGLFLSILVSMLLPRKK
jgi:hypothetical protein